MWLGCSTIFLFSLGILGYAYIGYPLTIFLLSRLFVRKIEKTSIEPPISIVMAAVNEEAHIAAKLDNLLALDYPFQKRQIIVVSDSSIDRTDAIVSSYAEHGVALERLDAPAGKAAALNRGVACARGEIIVFCDVRQFIDKLAVRHLIQNFSDARVGAASGELVINSDEGPGAYWKYEREIRFAEGLLDSTVGATGALYAIRKHLFQEIPVTTLLDDVYTPMQIVFQGYRVILDPEAKVYDREAQVQHEFYRKARTLAGNYQILRLLPSILNPLKNRLFIQYLSHKLVRLVCPFALLSLFIANVILFIIETSVWSIYGMMLVAQLTGYGFALNGGIKGNRSGRLSRLAYTFIVLNAAAVEGLYRYLRGDLRW